VGVGASFSVDALVEIRKSVQMGVGAGLYMYDVVVKKFTFAISSPDEFLFLYRCWLILGALSRFVFSCNFYVYLIAGKQFRSDLRTLFSRCSSLRVVGNLWPRLFK